MNQKGPKHTRMDYEIPKFLESFIHNFSESHKKKSSEGLPEDRKKFT